jgi:outer membrane receptor protein involved in Fe transport
LGWRIDQEFFQDNATIDRWLLRAGYGSIGNQEIGNYGYTSQLSLSSYYPFGGTRTLGSATSTYGNSKIKWETSKQFNIGTDIELWSGKLTASIDYFRKETSDMLVKQPLAASVGLANTAFSYANNGTMLNTGFEIQLGHENSIGNFHYSVVANAATLKNEVTKLNSKIAGGAVGSNYLTLTEEGYPVGSFYLYEMEGIFQNALDVFTHPVPQQGLQPGDVSYVDVSGDGVINEDDLKHVGSSIPKLTAGLNVSMSYKGWDMSLFFQGAYGQKVFSVLNRDIE